MSWLGLLGWETRVLQDGQEYSVREGLPNRANLAEAGGSQRRDVVVDGGGVGALFTVEASSPFCPERAQPGFVGEAFPPLLCCLGAASGEGLIAPELVEGCSLSCARMGVAGP